MVPEEAISDSRLKPNDRLVLMALYLFADSDGHCWPSRAELAGLTGLREQEISMRTTRLVELGWLCKEGKGGHSRSSHYYLRIPLHLKKTVRNTGTVSKEETVRETSAVQIPATVPVSLKNGTDYQDQTVQELSTGNEQINNRKKRGGEPEPAIAIADLENKFPGTDVQFELVKLVKEKGPNALQSREVTLKWLGYHELYRRENGYTGSPESGSKLDREQKRKEEQNRKEASAIQDAEIAGRDFGRQHDSFDREEALHAAYELGIPDQYLERFLLVAEGTSEKPELSLATDSRVRNGRPD